MGPCRRDGRPAHHADAATGPAQGPVEDHLRGACRRRAHAGAHHPGVAGVSRRLDLRRGVRRRLDHGRLPPVRPAVGRRAGLVWPDEPTDPLWRGSDEPRQLFHDEPRRRGRDDARHPRMRQCADWPGGGGGAHRPRRHRRGGVRRQPDHAPPAAGHRPGGAGRRAVRAGDLRRDDAVGARDRRRDAPRCAGVHPALHRGPCRRRLRRRGAVGKPAPAGGDDAGGGRGHQRRDPAGRQSAGSGLLLAHRPRLRGRADRLRSARGARRHRAGAHRPRDEGAALSRDRLRAVVRRARLRGGGRAAGRDRHLRLGHHRGDRRDAHGGAGGRRRRHRLGGADRIGALLRGRAHP